MPNPTWLEDAIEKYRRKLDHVKLRPQINLLLAETHRKASKSLEEGGFLDSKVQPVLDEAGVDVDTRLGYYDYARSLNKAQRTLEFMVDRIREHAILRARWETRGLSPTVLDKLDKFLIWNTTTP